MVDTGQGGIEVGRVVVTPSAERYTVAVTSSVPPIRYVELARVESTGAQRYMYRSMMMTTVMLVPPISRCSEASVAPTKGDILVSGNMVALNAYLYRRLGSFVASACAHRIRSATMRIHVD